MNPISDEKIVDSWKKNASQWAVVVRDGKIESRKLITDKAIVEVILSHSPNSVLDLGCGEGWLVRELASHVSHLVGVDVVPDLIRLAETAGGGHFLISCYEGVPAGVTKELFDVVVCNFSLLGKESVEELFRAVPAYMKPDGVFIVQTLHPVASNHLPYLDGWRDGSWVGFDSGFTDPAPWYFRTLESWVSLFSEYGLRLLDIREPIHPKTKEPASIIFIAAIAVRDALPATSA